MDKFSMRRELMLARLHLMSLVLEERTVGIPHEQKALFLWINQQRFPKIIWERCCRLQQHRHVVLWSPSFIFFLIQIWRLLGVCTFLTGYLYSGEGQSKLVHLNFLFWRQSKIFHSYYNRHRFNHCSPLHILVDCFLEVYGSSILMHKPV